MKFRILVDTIEHHTRRYEVEAASPKEAEHRVSTELLDFQNTYERLDDGAEGFVIVEVEPID